MTLGIQQRQAKALEIIAEEMGHIRKMRLSVQYSTDI